MGLDMYLYAKKDVCNRSWASNEEKAFHKAVKDAVPEIFDSGNLNTIEVSFEVAYWRKANAIHHWFVDNCQNGKDDCGTYYVDRRKIKELVDVCKQVLNTVETIQGECKNGTTHYPDETVIQQTTPGRIICQAQIAEDLLPTQDGFFFGNTDYDEYYIQDLEGTIRQLAPLLTKLEGWEFEYHSSW